MGAGTGGTAPAAAAALLLLLLGGDPAAAVAGDDASGSSGEPACPSKCLCTQNQIVCRNVGLDKIPDDLPAGETKYTKM